MMNQTPTQQWVYQQSSHYNYYTGQVVTYQDPSPIPTYQTLSQVFNTTQEGYYANGNPIYVLKAAFRFNLSNEAQFTTESMAQTADGYIQGGTGSATSGDNRAQSESNYFLSTP